MRPKLLLPSTIAVVALVLSACSGDSDSSSLQVPEMPSASSQESTSSDGEATLDPSLVTPDTETPSDSDTESDTEPYTNPLTGETSTGGVDQGVQDFVPSQDTPSITSSDAASLLIDSAGIGGNGQAEVSVGDFSSADVQAAYDTLLGFLVTGARSAAITSPGPNGFTSETAFKEAFRTSLGLWMSEPALESVINQSLALSRVPIVERTPEQQSFYALFPAALCQEENTSCLLSQGTEFSKPTIGPWTSGSGLAGLELTNQQYYVAVVPTYSGDRDTGIQRLAISFTLTAQMLPDELANWKVVGVKAANVAFQTLEQVGPVS